MGPCWCCLAVRSSALGTAAWLGSRAVVTAGTSCRSLGPGAAPLRASPSAAGAASESLPCRTATPRSGPRTCRVDVPLGRRATGGRKAPRMRTQNRAVRPGRRARPGSLAPLRAEPRTQPADRPQALATPPTADGGDSPRVTLPLCLPPLRTARRRGPTPRCLPAAGRPCDWAEVVVGG